MPQSIPAGLNQDHALKTLADIDAGFPFYVTANELRCSKEIPDQFHLFRVFDFGRFPRLYIVHGALSHLCHLDPVLYRAVI